MSGIVAAERRAHTTMDEDVERYVDTLYELVASGVPPTADVSLAGIERYLHEHARRAKSLAELRAFFDEHGLCLGSADLARPALQVLEPIPSVEPPPHALDAEGLQTLEDGADDATLPGVSLPTPTAVSVRGPRPRLAGWAPWALAAVTVLLGATCTWAYLTMSDLHAKLAHAQAQAADNRVAIERLGHQATEIRRDVGETGETLRRFERKSDELLDALLPAPVDR